MMTNPIILDTQPIKLFEAEVKSWVCAGNKAYKENVYLICAVIDDCVTFYDDIGCAHYTTNINQTVYPVPSKVIRKLFNEEEI